MIISANKKEEGGGRKKSGKRERKEPPSAGRHGRKGRTVTTELFFFPFYILATARGQKGGEKPVL